MSAVAAADAPHRRIFARILLAAVPAAAVVSLLVPRGACLSTRQRDGAHRLAEGRA